MVVQSRPRSPMMPALYPVSVHVHPTDRLWIFDFAIVYRLFARVEVGLLRSPDRADERLASLGTS